MDIGDRVRRSTYALESLREHSLGGYSQKLRDSAKREPAKQRARRGTVAQVIQNTHGGTVPTLRVVWDDGTESIGFADMVERAS